MMKLVFIEPDKSFKRYDILRRVINAAKDLSNEWENVILLFLIKREHHIEAYLCKQNSCNKIIYDEYTVNSLLDLLACRKPIIFDENGVFDIESICKADCIFMGLHSDPYGVIDDYLRNARKVKLGDISYMTSQCVHILGFYKNYCEDKKR